MEIAARRRESLVLLVTAVVVAFFVGVLSTMAVEAAAKALETWAIVALSTGGLVVCVAGAYLAILSRSEYRSVRTQFVLPYDRTNAVFLGVPKHPPSVAARVHFGLLTDQRRRELTRFDTWETFFGSPFERTLNDLIQALVLRFVLQLELWEDRKDVHIPLSELPGLLQENSFLQLMEEKFRDVAFHGPADIMLSVFGENRRFLRFETEYGCIAVQWKLGMIEAPYFSGPHVAITTSDNEKSVHDFVISVTAQTEFRLRHLYSREFEAFVRWSELVERRLSEVDWQRAVEYLPLTLLTHMITSVPPSKAK